MGDRNSARELKRETRRIDREITKLEERLSRARRTVSTLAGDREPPPRRERDGTALLRAGHDGTSTRQLIGAPMLLRLSRRFDGEFPAKRFEEVIERIRELTHDPGSVELTDKSLVWSSSPDRHPIQSHLMVRLMVSEAGPTKTPDPNRRDVAYFTTLTITDRLGALVGRLYGAFGTILGAGGAAAPVAASIAFPAFTPLFVIGWLGGVYGTTRLLYHRIADGRSRRLQDIFGALARDVEIWINGADS